MLEAAQVRAARALLGWRQEELAKASGVGIATIQRLENSKGPLSGYVSTVVRIHPRWSRPGCASFPMSRVPAELACASRAL